MEKDLIKKVISSFNTKGCTAIDLGCGDGYDSIFLIYNNWKVIAIDLFTEGIKKNTKSIDSAFKNNLIIRRQALENLDIPTVDLILSNLSIQFCKKEKIEILIENIKKSIKTEGRFAGQFYGEEDYRNKNYHIYTLTKEKLLSYFLNDFCVEYFAVNEKNINVKGKNEKEQIYEIIVKRIGY